MVHEGKPVSDANRAFISVYLLYLDLSRVVCNDPSCPREPSHSGLDTCILGISKQATARTVMWSSSLSAKSLCCEATEFRPILGQSGTAQIPPRRLCCPKAPCDSHERGPQPPRPADPVRLQRLLGLLLTDSIPETRRDFRSLVVVLASQVRRIRARGPLAPHTSR
jgi:hypothetical protein